MMIDAEDTPKRWDEAALGPLTEEVIRTRYQPPISYRVSRFTLPPEDSCAGAMRSGLCFCLRGHGRFIFGERVIALSAGEYVLLPSGSFFQESDEDEIFDVVHVWELPFAPSESLA